MGAGLQANGIADSSKTIGFIPAAIDHSAGLLATRFSGFTRFLVNAAEHFAAILVLVELAILFAGVTSR